MTVKEIPPRKAFPPSLSSWCWWLLPLLGVVLFLVPLISPAVVQPKWDEFIYAFDSQRILNGQVPYRDFFNFIPPAVYYVLAAIALPFGRVTLTIARYASLAVVLVNWILLRKALEWAGWSRIHALLLSLVYPICIYPFWPVYSHHWLVQTASMFFLWLLVAPALRERDLARSFLIGLCAGFAGLMLQTEALYLAVGSLALLLLEARGRGLAARVAALGAGWAVPILGGYLPLLAEGAGYGMIRDLVFWPLTHYSAEGNDNARTLLSDLPIRLQVLWEGADWKTDLWRTIPIVLSGSALYLLLVMTILAVVVAVFVNFGGALKRHSFRHPQEGMAVLVTVLILGIFPLGRPDWLRFLFLFLFVLALWLVVWGQTGVSGAARRIIMGTAIALLLAGFFYQSRWAWYRFPTMQELTDVDSPVREDSLNRWLHSPGVLGPDDTVAALYEGGEVYLYGAKPAIGYTFFTPLSENYNSLKDHETVAKQMKENRPRWVLVPMALVRAFLDPASPVGALIRRDYRLVGQIGGTAIYGRLPRKPA